MNYSRTFIRMSRRFSVDIATIMSKMEQANVPIAYTEGLKKICFTNLAKIYGDYNIGTIRISCNRAFREIHHQTLVHELAHHIDEEEDISGRDNIINEKAKKSEMMVDAYAQKDVGEYIAVGFEVYYFGTREMKAKLRKHNPHLYNVIKYLHRKYTAR